MDSFTLAIAHKEGREGAYTVILDAVREVNPPFSPEATVQEFAELLKRHRISKVIGDRYAGEFPRELFRNAGIAYELSDRTKSEYFVDFLPLINSRAVSLLDNPRLVHQLASLERRAASSGREKISKPVGGHDDLANAAAAALCKAWELASSNEMYPRSKRPQAVFGHQAVRQRFSRIHQASSRLNYDPYGSPPWRK